jgi:putative zinc finger protein
MEQNHNDCRAYRPRLEAWIRGLTDEEERRAIASHVARCEPCRLEAAGLDPSVLFQALRGGPIPGEFWDGFDARLRARIEAESRQSLAARLSGRLAEQVAAARRALGWAQGPALWAAPAAMLLVLGVTVAVLRQDLVRGPAGPASEAVRSPFEPPVVPARPGAGQPGTRTFPGAPAILPGLAAGAGDPPALEVVASPSARIYRFDTAGTSPIYFVVDESIEF